MVSATAEGLVGAHGGLWLPSPPGCVGAALCLDRVAASVPHGAPLHSPLTRLLSDLEQQRFARLPVRKRQIEWLAGRLAAKHALQRLVGIPHWPRQFSVSSDAAGRPSFDIARLSISHSRREAVAVAAHGPVGIDTETFDAVRADSLSLLLGPEEVLSVRHDWGCDAQVARTLLWCLKEALFKAAGGGAFVPFAMALRVRGWPPAAAQPVWRWQGALAGLQAPAPPVLAHWRADASFTEHAARVLVSRLSDVAPLFTESP